MHIVDLLVITKQLQCIRVFHAQVGSSKRQYGQILVCQDLQMIPLKFQQCLQDDETTHAMADHYHLAILRLGAVENVQKKGGQELSLITNVANLATEFRRIAKTMNVELFKFVIILEQDRPLPPRFLFAGVKAMDKNNHLIKTWIVSDPIS